MEALLRSGLVSLGLRLTETQIGQLLGFSGLLQKWGRVYNLTALREPAEIVTHHLLDCLAAVPALERQAGSALRILDVGSGAGLPGIVVAIACEHASVDCIDAVAKKAAFVQQAAGALRLANVRGIHGRVESVGAPYPLVTSRAFSSLPDFARMSASALAPGGSWMAMKGKYPADEIAALPPEVEVFHVEQLEVPGLDAERCLVWMRHAAA